MLKLQLISQFVTNGTILGQMVQKTMETILWNREKNVFLQSKSLYLQFEDINFQIEDMNSKIKNISL